MQTVNILFLFYLLIGMFGLIGAMRGWAKELLVTFSVILAIFLLTLFEKFGLFGNRTIVVSSFWVRSLLVGGLAFFGYQTGLLQRFVGSNRLAREKVQDALLGLLVGLLNGYMIVGSIWFFMHEAGYPFENFIAPPSGEAGDYIKNLINYMPPGFFGEPYIYFAVGLAFLFVLVVFI